MEKTCEELKRTGKPELFALVAFQQGAIDAAQLRKAIRLWLDKDQADLELVLVEAGFISATVHKKISQLLQNNRRFHDGQIAAPEHAISREIDTKIAAAGSKVRHRIDSSHSHSSEKSQSRRKRTEPSSYYDSFHEQFTREETFSTRVRKLFKFKRNFKRNISQIRQGSMALLESILDWFFAYYQRLILTVIGLLLVGASIYYFNQWLGKADATPISDGSQQRQLVLSDSKPVVAPQTDEEKRLDLPTLPDATVAKPTVAQRTDNSAELIDHLSELPSQSPSQSLSQSVPSSVGLVPSNDNKLAPIRQQQLLKVNQLITNNNPELAIVFLESTLENFTGDKKELEEALIASLLAARDFDRAGQHLVHPLFLDCESPTWDLMFTCWLLYAPQASRISVAETLGGAGDTVPLPDALQRALACIKIRDGDGVESLPQAAASGWFSDTLFRSVAAHNSGNRQQAVEQLTRARQLFDQAWGPMEIATPSQLVGRKMIDAALANYALAIAK